MRIKDLTGQQFHFLKVIGDSGLRNKAREVLWSCECVCGKVVNLRTGTLKVGDNKSCGCMKVCLISTHGMSNTGVHNSWRTMLERCTNPKHKSYEYYGKLDIDPSWFDFEKFLQDMGDRPEGMSLDRVDWTRGYCKDNCRWATASTQQQNKPASERNFNGYPGICLTNNRYVARIRYKGERIYLGCFKTAEEAHAVYDAKGLELFGEEWVSYIEDNENDLL